MEGGWVATEEGNIEYVVRMYMCEFMGTVV